MAGGAQSVIYFVFGLMIYAALYVLFLPIIDFFQKLLVGSGGQAAQASPWLVMAMYMSFGFVVLVLFMSGVTSLLKGKTV